MLSVASYGTIFVITAFPGNRSSAGTAGLTLDPALSGFHAVFFCGAILGIAIFALSLLVKEGEGTGKTSGEAGILL